MKFKEFKWGKEWRGVLCGRVTASFHGMRDDHNKTSCCQDIRPFTDTGQDSYQQRKESSQKRADRGGVFCSRTHHQDPQLLTDTLSAAGNRLQGQKNKYIKWNYSRAKPGQLACFIMCHFFPFWVHFATNDTQINCRRADNDNLSLSGRGLFEMSLDRRLMPYQDPSFTAENNPLCGDERVAKSVD